MKYAATGRKRTGCENRTDSGALSNPAGELPCSFWGVYDRKLAEPLAQVLSNLGVVRGVVVCGSDGLDEITLTGETDVYEIRFGKITSYTIAPEQFGLTRCNLSDLVGGDPKENAKITKEILEGKERGPKRDVILMNAGMSLYLGIDDITLEDGIKLAAELIDNGKALDKFKEPESDAEVKE